MRRPLFPPPLLSNGMAAPLTSPALCPYATVNVKTHVPMTLELKPPNFTKWSSTFRAMCGKFGLLTHLQISAEPPTDEAWVQADYCVRSWMFGSVSDPVLNLTMDGDNQTAGQLWTAITNVFQANKAPRAIFLSHEFHSMTQGDSSIDDYCVRMKEAADALRDVGQPVSEPNLVLNLLRGLSEQYSSVADNIAGQVDLTFTTARNQLLLKELRLKNEEKVRAASALVATFSGNSSGRFSPSGIGQQQQEPHQQQPRGDGGRRNTRKDGKRQPWGFNPWTGERVNPGERVTPPGGHGAFGYGNQGSSRGSSNPGASGGFGGQPRRYQGGLLGAAPQANTAFAPTPAPSGVPTWDQAGLIAALQQLTTQGASPWVVDSGATSHMTASDGILFQSQTPSTSSILVGNGTRIPVTSSGNSILSTTHSDFILNNVLVVPSIVRNLLSVRQFTRDNHCSIEFDATGFSVKDPRTGRVMLRCASDGDLYTLPAAPSCHLAVSSSLWHRRLGHPAPAALDVLKNQNFISCHKVDRGICHTCQLGKHTRLPFTSSQSSTSVPFELIHCDVWTSPIKSNSGFSYYLVCLDDYTHFCWTFPLRHKSDVQQHLFEFVAYAQTQFGLPVKCFQADNGTEFVNKAISSFLAARGILLRCSCPHTSPQNGKAERILRTLNNTIRTLLLQASIPPPYWAEALAAATYLLNRRPSSSIRNEVPYARLHGTPPTYAHLRVFGCLCYPNLQATSPHKLAPRSTACVFLGYPSAHKGYRCLDLSTRRIIISRHVIFDEHSFPFAASSPTLPPTSLNFLLDVNRNSVYCPTNNAGGTSIADAPTTLDAEQPPVPAVLPPGQAGRTSLDEQEVLPAPAVPRQATPTDQQPAPSTGCYPPDGSSTLGGPAPLVPPFQHFYTRQLTPADPPTADSSAAAPQAALAPHAAPVPPPPPPPPRPTTRTMSGAIPRVNYEGLTASASPSSPSPSPLPTNYRSALTDANWRTAMMDEY